MEEYLKLSNFNITNEDSENLFITKLIEGNYYCENNIYSEIWNLFQQMAEMRKGRRHRKTFFGWLFKQSSFLDAYNEANEKETLKVEEKVKYIIGYKKYSKRSVMKKIESEAEKIIERIQRENEVIDEPKNVYEQELERITSEDVHGLQRLIRYLDTVKGETTNYYNREMINNSKTGNKKLNYLKWVYIMCLTFLDVKYKEIVQSELENINKIAEGKTVEIKDTYAKNIFKNQNHTCYSYINYLYNKYVVQLENQMEGNIYESLNNEINDNAPIEFFKFKYEDKLQSIVENKNKA